MKKLGLILILGVVAMFIAPNVEAQSNLISANTHAIIKTLDTVVNTGTKTMTSGRVSGPLQNVSVTTLNVAATGTFTGIARLWGSLDNVTYTRIRSTQLQGAQVDSLLIDAAHAKYTWVVEKSPFQYYQVQTTGPTSGSFTVQGKYVAH